MLVRSHYTLPPNVNTGNQAGGLSSVGIEGVSICESKEGDDCGSQPACAAMRKEEEAMEFCRDNLSQGSPTNQGVASRQPSRTIVMGSCQPHGRIAY
jgi:hypothetical protein